MYEIKAVETKAQLSERLSGLSEVGRELVLKATAKSRHSWRIVKTLGTAINYLEQLGIEDRGALVWAQLESDKVGLGGRLGLEGASTARIPQFRKLGKGRKQASDGAAWTAAISQAVEDMRGGGVISAQQYGLEGDPPRVEIENSTVTVEWEGVGVWYRWSTTLIAETLLSVETVRREAHGVGVVVECSIPVPLEVVPLKWQLVIAKKALLDAVQSGEDPTLWDNLVCTLLAIQCLLEAHDTITPRMADGPCLQRLKKYKEIDALKGITFIDARGKEADFQEAWMRMYSDICVEMEERDGFSISDKQRYIEEYANRHLKQTGEPFAPFHGWACDTLATDNAE